MVEEIWVEKYRPKTLDEVVGQDETIIHLKGYVKSKNLPHLLFSGPAGTGKTASAHALARDLYGENWRENFIELNASVSRNTQVLVRIGSQLRKVSFAELDKIYFGAGSQDGSIALPDLEVLSLDGNFRVGWASASKLIRHRVSKLLKLKLVGGAELELTGNHSVMVLGEHATLIPKHASQLRLGDFLISFSSDGSSGSSSEARPSWSGSGLRSLINSELHLVRIREMELIDYEGFVYDLSVPGTQIFFAGQIPIALHNSDERGIETVRTAIKDFARTATLMGAPFKLIFLDESDALTADAQAALRRTMERYSATCRFILSANYSSRIIEPIQSRCSVYRFKPLTQDAMAKRINYIAHCEGLELAPGTMDALYYISQGDMRRAINALQAAAMVSKQISPDSIYRSVAMARPEQIQQMLELALTGDFFGARSILSQLMYEQGVAAEDLLDQLHRVVVGLEMDERKKLLIVDQLGELEFRLAQGANERIQMDALLAKLALLGA